MTILIPLVIVSKAKQSRHRINRKIQQNRDFTVSIAANNNTQPVDELINVYNSWISDKICDYGCSMFYENPEYLYLSYVEGEPLKD